MSWMPRKKIKPLIPSSGEAAYRGASSRVGVQRRIESLPKGSALILSKGQADVRRHRFGRDDGRRIDCSGASQARPPAAVRYLEVQFSFLPVVYARKFPLPSQKQSPDHRPG